ncbi:hypothetical protein P7C71_g506, partial [Lecanoromycetidae sp. Uapishka_2]
MTQPSLRPPSNLQPRPKAVPTFSSTSLAASPVPTTPQLSRPSSRSRQPSPARSAGATDVSDKATAALIRRVLCPQNHGDHRPINELLPPLTSSNDVDLQLYAIIAVVVKDLVQSWYGKITPDQSFVEEVVRIVAHCTTQLESRLRTIDLEVLVFDEIPALIEGHVNGQHGHGSHSTPCIVANVRASISSLSPVLDPAVSATVVEQQENETDYRQLLVQGALAVLLPTEDLENACLRTLVADVIAETILGNSIGGKVCEGWFIWGSVSKLIEMVKARVEPQAKGEQIEVDTRSRLEKFGLLADKSKDKEPSKTPRRTTFSSVFWRVLQYGYLTFITIRFVILGFSATYSRPLRSSTTSKTGSTGEKAPIEGSTETSRKTRPILSFRVLPLISILLDLPRRMPWLSGSFALLQHHLIHGPLRVGATDGMLDQYLHHLILTQLDPSTLLPQILAQTRQALFPNSTLPPPAPPPPSASEVLSIKRTCATSILSLLPPAVCRRLFGTDELEEWIEDVEGELDVWGDGYLNKHVAYAVLEFIVVRVLPELAEKRVEELMRERLGDV